MPSTTIHDDWMGIPEPTSHTLGTITGHISEYSIVWNDGNQWIRFGRAAQSEPACMPKIHIDTLEGLL